MKRILLRLGCLSLVAATGGSNPSFNSGQLIYHEAQRRLLMVGGNQPPSLPDVLQLRAWRPPVWTLIHMPSSPAMRTLAAVVYDSRRARVVVYGGLGNKGLADPRADTWEWDGRHWFEVTDTNVGPRDHWLQQHSKASRYVDVGWHDVAESPAGRNGHAMVFDRRAGVVLMWGGTTGAEHLDDLWQWDGRTWKEISVTSPRPSKRTGAHMVYDTHRQRVVLYGGRLRENGRVNDSDEMWDWDGQRWTLIINARSEP